MNKVKWAQVYKMLAALNSCLLLQYKLVQIIDLNFSNSLIIHKENSKEINV